jgi:hypothetical protein
MRRSLYIGLLRIHPPGFRQRYADEMLSIFDEAAPHGNVAPLFADAFRSLCRQWLLRPGLAPSDQASPQTAGGAPAFLDIEDHGLSRGALFQGALISALTFAGVLYCATHGAGHWEGVQQIFYSLEATSWNAAEKAQPAAYDSVSESLGSLISRLMMLDVNGDGKISKTERRGWLANEYCDLLDHTYTDRDGDITEEALRREILWWEQRGRALPRRPMYFGKTEAAGRRERSLDVENRNTAVFYPSR